ncbi:MAG: hypothetical protein RMN53_16145 [Anaerolineae bacterium]|nr:hypothetical protein [Anaerolineae bacterium]
MGEPRQVSPHRQGSLGPGGAVGQQQEAQAGMLQRVHVAHAHPDAIPLPQRQGVGLVLLARGLDQDGVVAEGHRRRNRAHAGQRRQAQPQALERAGEHHLLHHPLAEQRRRQLRRVGGQRHVFGAKEHLNPLVRWRRVMGRQGEANGPELHRAVQLLAQQQVGRAQEAGDELGLRVTIELLRWADLQQAAEAHHADAISYLKSLLLVVGDQDSGDPQLALDPAQGTAQLDADLGVQRA